MLSDSLKAEQLSEIIGVSALITSSMDPQEIRRRAVEAATRVVNADRASLLLIDKRMGSLYFEVALGDGLEDIARVRLVPGQGIAGSVALGCVSAVINDVQADPRFDRSLDEKTGYTTRSMICVPLACRGEPLGVLQVINKKDGDFNDEDLSVTEALANQIAIAIENARLYQRVRRGFIESTVYAMVLALAVMGVGGWLVSLGG